jgi:hypothetical protein
MIAKNMKCIKIRCVIPFHVEVPDGIESGDEGPTFYPRVHGVPIGLSFERTSGDAEVRGTVTVKRDRMGRATKSKVQAIIHPKHANAIPRGGTDEIPGTVAMFGSSLNDHEGRMIRQVVQAINKFLMHYRQKTGYHWIRPLTPEDIMKFEVKTDDRGFRERVVTGGPMSFDGKKGFQPEDAETLYQALEEEKEPNFYQDLHLDIQEKIDLEESRVAVLLSYTLFETWVKNSFVNAVSAGEKTEEEARNIITSDGGQYIRFSNILKNCLKHHLDIDFQSYEGYEQWEKGLYKLRNKVAHEGYIPQKSEAKNAHHESVEGIQYIRNKLGDRLSGEPESANFTSLEESPYATRHH